MLKLKIRKIIKIIVARPECWPEQHGNWIDLSILIPETILSQFMILEIGKNYVLDSGVRMTLPKWYRAEIKPRSSTYKNWGIILVNSVGEVEDTYSGSWFMHVNKLTEQCKTPVIKHGERAFQFQISLRPDAPWYKKVADLFISGFKFEEVDVLSTIREGHGSTGT